LKTDKCTNRNNSSDILYFSHSLVLFCSRHPTSCCSVAEIMSVLFFHTMKYRPDDPKNPNNDRFVLSKGHAAPALYSMWTETGFLKESDLVSMCQVDSALEGHPTPKQQFVDVATGSLGQGLGVACGMAYSGKYFDKASYRVYCLLGDGEMSEGSVWEAMAFASYYQLDNLVAILDINRLGQSDPAPLQHHMEKYQRRCEAFGWHAIIVDGHSIEELCKALTQPRHQPTAIIAKTIKGKGIPVAEDKMGWHAKVLPKDMAEGVIRDLQSRILNSNKRMYPATPTEDAPPVSLRNARMPSAPSYKPGEKVSTRKAYGMALAKLGRYNERVVAMDVDTKNLTYSEIFKNEHPNRFVECYSAEQNMVWILHILHTKVRNFCLLSGLNRARAQNDNLCGELDWIFSEILFITPNKFPLKIFCICLQGICYIRTSRPESSIIYNSNEDFHVGQAKVVCQSKDDQVTVVGAGVTLHEALAAAEQLKKDIMYECICMCIYIIFNIIFSSVVSGCTSTGGLGEAVSSALVNESGFVLQRLAVPHVPRSGKMSDLLKIYGIDRESIVQAVRKMVSSSANAK
uniref:transketolase n=1 Tax=Astyanax mexicanus TaxID=7994 RepID=A0A8B9R835_ASTMX